MSAELPEDLKGHFAALEQQAYSLLRTGKYELAEKLYRLMSDTVINRQETENRRIHKGAYLHQIGFSLVLQDRLSEALQNFLLAYVEDTLNVPLTREDDADGFPAARVLREGFHLGNANFQMIKEISRRKKEDSVVVKNPTVVLEEYLNQIPIDQSELLSLCDRIPSQADLRRLLIVNLTPQARRALNEVTSKLAQRVLRLASDLAKARGHPDQVTEEDISDAIKRLEGDFR